MKHLCLLAMFAAASVGGADEIKLNWQASGMTDAAGLRYARLTLSPEKPNGIKAVPDGLTAPFYGTLQLGPKEASSTFFVIVDEPDGEPSRLFVDANGNGDLTDDPAPEWTGKRAQNSNGVVFTNYTGAAVLHVSYGDEKLALHIGLRRNDKRAVRAGAPTNYMFYYRDYGRAGQLSLGGQTYPALLLDQLATGDFRPVPGAANAGVALMLDLNHDGIFERHGELFDVTKPFNIGGTTWQIENISPSGGTFQIVKSSETVEETKPRPVLQAGHPSLAFEAKSTAGDTIHFPSSYKGKLVLVDFWATWCVPCRRELPHVIAAYNKFHDKGLEVLGVSLDKTNAADAVAKFTTANKMPWPEIYDGGYWSNAIAKIYLVDSIPHPFLIDGDTGMIIAEGEDARGGSLSKKIEEALAARR